MKAPASSSVIAGLILAVSVPSGKLLGDTDGAISAPPLSATLNAARPPNDKTYSRRLPPPQLSRPTSEVVRLTQSGVDEGVVLAFIEKSGPFELTADDIVLLSDLGVSNQVVHTMLARDGDHNARLSQSTNASSISLSIPRESKTAPNTKSPQEETQITPELARVPAVQPMASLETSLATQPLDTAPGSPTGAPVGPEALRKDSLTSEKGNKATTPPRKKVTYPVREPYPVELTAPIVFLEPPTF